MAEPITWRTIGSTVGGGSAASLLAQGQRQATEGLDAISRLFRDDQRLQQQNFERARDNNTAKYLDAVAAAGGVDALQNPETRAGLEAMRAGFGAAIDRNATRNAIDSQVTGLQRAEAATAQYEDMQLERAQRGLIDQGVALAQAGDMEGVKKLLADNQFLNEGRLANELTGIVDAGTRRQYAAEDQARQGRNEQRQIAQFQESMAAAAENRVMRKEARQDAKEERDFRRNSRVLDDAAKQAQGILTQQEARNPWARTSTDPTKDAQALLSNLSGGEYDAWLSSNESDRRAMTKSVTKLLSEGVEVDGKKYQIPPAMLQQELQAIAGNVHILSSPARDIENHFRDILSGNTGAPMRAQADLAQQTKANARNFINTLNRAKTRLGSSGSLDTSGIVAGLAELAGGYPVSSSANAPALMPEQDEDDNYR